MKVKSESGVTKSLCGCMFTSLTLKRHIKTTKSLNDLYMLQTILKFQLKFQLPAAKKFYKQYRNPDIFPFHL